MEFPPYLFKLQGHHATAAVRFRVHGKGPESLKWVTSHSHLPPIWIAVLKARCKGRIFTAVLIGRFVALKVCPPYRITVARSQPMLT